MRGVTKILVAGVGGVGGYFGGLLARKFEKNKEVEIYFLARGNHLKQIREKGLTVIKVTETLSLIPSSQQTMRRGLALWISF